MRNSNKLIRSPIYLDKIKTVLMMTGDVRGKVLDLGFGYGYLEKQLLAKRKKIELYGIDISSFAVSKARKNIYGTFLKGNIKKIPFSNAMFACVVVLDVLEHLNKSDVGKALSEVYRVAKKNCVLIFSVPINEAKTDTKNNLHVRRYTAKSIESEIKIAGFSVVETKFLYAYPSFYRIKSFLSGLFGIGHPNLIVIKALK